MDSRLETGEVLELRLLTSTSRSVERISSNLMYIFFFFFFFPLCTLAYIKTKMIKKSISNSLSSGLGRERHDRDCVRRAHAAAPPP